MNILFNFIFLGIKPYLYINQLMNNENSYSVILPTLNEVIISIP